MYKKLTLMTVVLLLLFGSVQAQNKSPRKFFGRNTFGEAWLFIGNRADNTVDINFYGITGAVRQTSDKEIKKLFGMEGSASKYQFKGIDSLKFNGSGEGKDFSLGPTWERWKSTSNRLNTTRFSAGSKFSTRKSNERKSVNNNVVGENNVEQDTRLYTRLRLDLQQDQMHFSRITFDAWYELQVQGKGEKLVDGVKSSYKPEDRSNFGLGLEVGVLSFADVIGKNTAITFSLGAGFNKLVHSESSNGEIKSVVSLYNYWSDILRITYSVGFNLKTSDGSSIKTVTGALDVLNLFKGFF